MGGGGEGVWRWGKREIIYIDLSLHCHHQNDSCIMMGSDESHLNFPLSVRDKVTRQCPQTTTFLKRERDRGAEAESSRGLSAYQPNALPLGQTGSLLLLVECCFTSTETVGLLGTGAQDVHLHFHTAPELWFCP